MSTATKPVPEHGTPARGNGVHGGRPPCKCEPCVLAIRAARKRRKVHRELGRPALIDAAPARERLLILRRDMTWASIALASACDASNLVRIALYERTEINRTTHNKIMAIVATPSTDRGQCIDATGTVRRIRALKVIGHSYRVIAETAGSTSMRMLHIAEGRQPTVRQWIADGVADAYRRLAYRLPPEGRCASRTRNLAAAHDWAGPLAWDGNIDDPNAVPDTTGVGSDGPRTRDNLRNDEIKHLAGFQLPMHEIAKRVGLEEKDVDGRLAKWRSKRDRKQVAA